MRAIAASLLLSLLLLVAARAANATPGAAGLTFQIRLNSPVPADVPICRPGTVNESITKDVYFDLLVDVDGNPFTGETRLGGSELVIRLGILNEAIGCSPRRVSFVNNAELAFFEYRGGFPFTPDKRGSPASLGASIKVASGPGQWAGRAIEVSIPESVVQEISQITSASRFQIAAAYATGTVTTNGVVTEYKTRDFMGYMRLGEDGGDEIADTLSCKLYLPASQCFENAELDRFIDLAGFQAQPGAAVSFADTFAMSSDAEIAGYLAVSAKSAGTLAFGGVDYAGDQVSPNKALFQVSSTVGRFDALVQVGNTGAAVALQGVAQIPTLRTNGTEITSRGSFTGDAGQTIDWTSVSHFTKGKRSYDVTYFFRSAAALGRMRLVSFADLNGLGAPTDNYLRVTGGSDTGRLQLVATNSTLKSGVGHQASYAAARGVALEGWAAARSTDLRARVEAGTQTYAPTGNVDTATLPAQGTSTLGSPQFGPGDVATAFAFITDPAATEAEFTVSVVTSIDGERGEQPAPAAPAAPTTATYAGIPPAVVSRGVVSGDGSAVAIVTSLSGLAPNDSNGTDKVYVASGGKVALVSVDETGHTLTGKSANPAISWSGSTVAFDYETAPGQNQLRIWTAKTGASVAVAGSDAPGTRAASVSGSGAKVALVTPAALDAADTNGAADVYLVDVTTLSKTLVSKPVAGGVANGASDAPSVSFDGDKIAFQSTATNLSADSNGSTSDVFLWSGNARTLELVSRNSNGTQANAASSNATISGDGGVVAFQTRASNLFAGQTTGASKIAAWSKATRDVVLASAGTAGGAGDAAKPSISGDGNFIAYYRSDTSNSVGNVSLVVRDQVAGTTFAQRVLGAGSPESPPPPSMSADANRIVSAKSVSGAQDAVVQSNALFDEQLALKNIDASVTGSWYNPAQSGHGFVMEYYTAGEKPYLLVTWFTFLQGQPRWLIGVGEVVNGAATVDFVTTRGARFPSPAFDSGAVVRDSWGRATFRFYGPNKARVDWSSGLSGFNTSSLWLTRLTSAKPGLQDRLGLGTKACVTSTWYNPQQDGHGFMLEVVGNSAGTQQLFAVWYVYDGAGNQQWLVGLGPIIGNRAVVPMQFLAGGEFPPAFAENQVTRNAWGNAEFVIDNDEAITVSWTPTASGYTAGTLALQRLVPPPRDRACSQ